MNRNVWYSAALQDKGKDVMAGLCRWLYRMQNVCESTALQKQ